MSNEPTTHAAVRLPPLATADLSSIALATEGADRPTASYAGSSCAVSEVLSARKAGQPSAAPAPYRPPSTVNRITAPRPRPFSAFASVTLVTLP
jgi:hypothetical protein